MKWRRFKRAIGDLSLSTWAGFALVAAETRGDNRIYVANDLAGDERGTKAII